MLLQVDGSHHAWLEQRGPRFALLLAVDDATGAVVHALFRPAEDARGYFLLMEQVLRCSGIPLALYSDRHAVFRASAQQRAGGEASTQFARALAELGVRLIFARSPQAKGRVERMAGTFQDRLVTELRLASATTIGEAQAVIERFLPRFNARFAVAAQQPEPAWRPLDPALDLGAILAFRHTRSVARDNTVKYHWRTLQLLPSASPRIDAPPSRLSLRICSNSSTFDNSSSFAAGNSRSPERSHWIGRRWGHSQLRSAITGRWTPSGTRPSRSAPLSHLTGSPHPAQACCASAARELRSTGAGARRLGPRPQWGPPRPQAHPARASSRSVNAAAPTARRPRASRFSCTSSMRATARLLGISRNSIRR